MMCVYVMPFILYVEWKLGHFGILYMNANIEPQRSRNFNVSCKNSIGRKLLSMSLLLVAVVSKYDNKHNIQSRPALLNTNVLSLSKNTRNISVMLDVFNGRLRAFRNVPNNGRQPERISVRCASTISYRQATI